MSIVADSKARIRWPQQQRLNLAGHFDLFANDGAGGGVNFANAINPAPIDAWPDGEGKAGWGLGEWGQRAWGFGGGGLGWGSGAWGLGMWGIGTAMMEHLTPLLADSAGAPGWIFAVVGFDAAGNPALPSAGTQAEVALAGIPAEPKSIKADSWDDQTKTITFALGLSPDDQTA